MRAPIFWKNRNNVSILLQPLAMIYGWVASRRRKSVFPYKLPIPVICIGNLVAGGAGKTPVALALGTLLKAQGKNVQYLSRGYKGSLKGPIQVNAKTHTSYDVGDEPLLLAEILSTWVAKDRIAGAKATIEAGAEILIMDDGFQNPSLYKDISLLVIDGEYGFGNGLLMPAGPLRESILSGMSRTNAIILIGNDVHGVLKYAPSTTPIIRAKIEPKPGTYALKDKTVVAFAGIGRPRKFHRTLQQLGCIVHKMVAYPDHYHFKDRDLHFLHNKAKEHDALLVTTTKDYARLPIDRRTNIIPVPVEIVFEDVAVLLTLLPK
jgi:tetraacyldisaccharide 4'-kinase